MVLAKWKCDISNGITQEWVLPFECVNVTVNHA
jgi:hypothetical protein